MYPTPSTSPARRCVSSLVRHTDSPSKRRKFHPAYNASFSSHVDPRDAERRSPSISNVWSALENKSTCRLDDNDRAEAVEDRGVLRGKARTRTVSRFADAEEVQRESAGPAGEDHDDNNGDEIGGCGSLSDLGYLFNIPPKGKSDRRDAEDLKAFLAAEEVRKAKDGLSEDGLYDAEGYVDGSHGETDGSVIEVEAESALAVSEEESDDELDGYDKTVGEGALLWEVGAHLDNCSEPLSIENDCTTPKVVPTLARHNMTPTQLRTPPLSRSSAISPHVASFPSRKPPVNLSPSPPARHQSNSGMTNRKRKQKETRSPERPTDTLQSKWKGLKRDSSVRPTKKLLVEVFVPSLRCGINMPADPDESPSSARSRGRTTSTSNCPDNKTATRQASNHGSSISSTSKPHRRHPMPGVLPDAQVVDIDDQVTNVPEPVGRSEARVSTSPPRNAKGKRVLSGDANMGDDRMPKTRMSEDLGEDDNATLPKTFAATSDPADIPRSPSLSRLRHASVVPPPASLDFWHQCHVSAASPYSVPYPPHVSYVSFGPPPPPAPDFSHANPHHQSPLPALQAPSHHPSTPTSPWPYAIPYSPTSQPHPHPHCSVWPYQQYPYPVAHLQHTLHPSSSSSFPPFTPCSGDDPPSFLGEPLSFPTPSPIMYRKRNGKKVSFPVEECHGARCRTGHSPGCSHGQ